METKIECWHLDPDGEPPDEPESLEFRVIGTRGEERTAVGLVWGAAPAWRGQKALWVRTLDAQTMLVVIARRRQRAGRGGRVVEKGEAWSDGAMRAWQRDWERRPAPAVIRGASGVEETELAQWCATVAALVGESLI